MKRSLSLFLFFHAYLTKATFVEVTIPQGTLIGRETLSRNGTKYFAFNNIPFAKPPVGDLRFEPPQDPEPWTGIRNETFSSRRKCAQINLIAKFETMVPPYVGKEDCLYLYVYTPKADPKAKLPVMVWIHGGSFSHGSGAEYSPDYFMDYPVVVVTVNYRLGTFGFFSTGDEALPGNNGMKDQVAALRWIQRNIHSFGGDPKKVTIFGESAGSSSVNFHLYSPLSTGLFHQAIGQSGSVLASWTTVPKEVVKARANAVSIFTGCPVSSDALKKCLKKLSPREMLEIEEKFEDPNRPTVTLFSVVEEPRHTKGAFITKFPCKTKILNEVPYMAGFTSAEGGLMVAVLFRMKGSLEYLSKNYKRVFPVTFGYSHMEDDKCKDELSETIKQYYIGDEPITKKEKDHLITLMTDAFFTADIIEEAMRHKMKTYFYMYDHHNKPDLIYIGFRDTTFGVTHASDLISLFPLPLFGINNVTGIDLQVSKRMVKLWVNFATNGNPNDAGTDKWPPIKKNELPYLRITTEDDISKQNLLSEDKYEDRYKLWKSISQKIWDSD